MKNRTLLILSLLVLVAGCSGSGSRRAGGSAGEYSAGSGSLVEPSTGGSSGSAGEYSAGTGGQGGSLVEPSTGGSSGSSGASGAATACSGLCDDAPGVVQFDALGRVYLWISAAAGCHALTPAELGFAVMSWNCQSFPGERTLLVNGAAYPECSAAPEPIHPTPQLLAQRNGGYCFQVNAGAGTPLVFLL